MTILREIERIAKQKAILYKFVYNNLSFFYCSNLKKFTFKDDLYIKDVISHDEIVKYNNKSSPASVSIETTIDNDIVKILQEPDQTTTILFFIYEVDVQDKSIFKVLVTGEVNGYTSENEKATLICSEVSENLQVLTLQYYYSSLCPFEQYGKRCGLDYNTFAYNTKILNISDDRRVFTVESLPSDYLRYKGGLLKNNNNEKQVISDFNYTDLKIILDSPSLKTSNINDYIKFSPTCSSVYTECKNSFNNLDNFGGFIGINGNAFEPNKLK